MKAAYKTVLTLALSACLVAPAIAKVPADEAQQLKDGPLTPMGAERAANADGSIPAWTGAMLGVPKGLDYPGTGSPYPDPYANEKPLFVITAENYQQYAGKLTEGQQAMFKQYPQTFRMPVYPSHRDGRYHKLAEDRAFFNAQNTQLVNGVDGLRNFNGGAPFPIPKDGAEALWNGRVNAPNFSMEGVMDDIAVFPDGSFSVRTLLTIADYPFASHEHAIGVVDEKISIYGGLVHLTTEAPVRDKGQMTIVHEPLDQVTYPRNAWIYLPGVRRVKQAPTVGYDTPDAPGGLMTVDDMLGFNGAMDRYDWTLIGKKEIYIPYHAYKFDNPKATYKDILTPYHASPDYMRYELHRVWVVEANLKKGSRHIYAKRRFYMDEDSWLMVSTENFDGRGELWRMSLINTLYDYAVQGYIQRTLMFHDLKAGAYIAIRMANEREPTKYNVPPRGEGYYTPANLRKMGTR